VLADEAGPNPSLNRPDLASKIAAPFVQDDTKHVPKTRVAAGHGIARNWVFVLAGIAPVACGSDDRAKQSDMVSLIFTGKSNSEYSALTNLKKPLLYFALDASVFVPGNRHYGSNASTPQVRSTAT
jgi:hypothetical protein